MEELITRPTVRAPKPTKPALSKKPAPKTLAGKAVKKPKKKLVVIVVPKPGKIGLATQLAAIQARYRTEMLAAYDHPADVWSARIRAALATLLAEKAALGIKDGEEAEGEG